MCMNFFRRNFVYRDANLTNDNKQFNLSQTIKKLMLMEKENQERSQKRVLTLTFY